jgi:hypothetical protein
MALLSNLGNSVAAMMQNQVGRYGQTIYWNGDPYVAEVASRGRRFLQELSQAGVNAANPDYRLVRVPAMQFGSAYPSEEDLITFDEGGGQIQHIIVSSTSALIGDVPIVRTLVVYRGASLPSSPALSQTAAEPTPGAVPVISTPTNPY